MIIYDAGTLTNKTKVVLESDHAKEIEKWRVAEKEISDAYLRIRKLVGAWDTQKGGADRFEVTESAIRKLVSFWEWSRLADKQAFEMYEYKEK